jgi:hypothetical protein
MGRTYWRAQGATSEADGHAGALLFPQHEAHWSKPTHRELPTRLRLNVPVPVGKANLK